ncbi:hypothetical protein NEOKW01_0941 [Nematocida sp. AWRm80]|nr:hypothetical protein NEOKW01_0941 [Nematocida sp. AWRm80]
MAYLEYSFDCCGTEKNSVICRYNDSKCLCLVNGPFEPSSAILDRFKCTIRVIIAGPQSIKSDCAMYQEYLEEMVERVVDLRKYPRSVIEIRVFVLDNSSDLLACIINAVSVCVIGSGIYTTGILFGVSQNTFTQAYRSANGSIDQVLAINEDTTEESIPESSLRDILEKITFALKQNYSLALPL